MHFLREAIGPIYDSGLKEKTILACFVNYHCDQYKKPNTKHKNKNNTEEGEKMLSLTSSKNIFHNI